MVEMWFKIAVAVVIVQILALFGYVCVRTIIEGDWTELLRGIGPYIPYILGAILKWREEIYMFLIMRKKWEKEKLLLRILKRLSGYITHQVPYGILR